MVKPLPKDDLSAEPALRRVVEADQEQAMQVLVGLSGDFHEASKVLEEQYQVFYSPKALKALSRGRCRQLYASLQESGAGKLEDALVRDAREVAGRAMGLEKQLLEAISDQLAAGTVDDPSRAAANVSKVKQTAIDKLLALTGRPTQITQHHDAAQIIRALEGKGVLIPIEAAIDSTAEDVA